MNKILLLLLLLLPILNSYSSVGIHIDTLYPVGSVLLNERNQFNSDIRFDYSFKNKWSLGAQFNFLKSSSEDSASTTATIPDNQLPKFHQVRDRNLIFFGRWYKNTFSESSIYLGLGVGLANREFSVYEDGRETKDSSSGIIYSAQLGYQWMLTGTTGIGFELNFIESSVDENTKGAGTGYTYNYSKDVSLLEPKILLTHRF